MALNNQGVIAVNKKQWQAAVEALTEALTRDHSYTKAQWNLSLALQGRAVELMQNKNYSAALNDLHKAYYLDVHLGARDANGSAAKHINEAIKEKTPRNAPPQSQPKTPPKKKPNKPGQ
ncbi:MAG: hypothetical protein IPO31_17875 [Candidatus Obscuribacter sp.]|nr:hypothetical protein [Candidatus Obscuribacter sp.]